MKVTCNYNDPSNLPDGVPGDFDYGLELDKEYIVMGIASFKKSNCLYYLIDENGRPSWFPFQLFNTCDNSLPKNWFIHVNQDERSSDISSLWGFDELCNDEMYFDKLMDRDELAMRIYYKRIMEFENRLDTCS